MAADLQIESRDQDGRPTTRPVSENTIYVIGQVDSEPDSLVALSVRDGMVIGHLYFVLWNEIQILIKWFLQWNNALEYHCVTRSIKAQSLQKTSLHKNYFCFLLMAPRGRFALTIQEHCLPRSAQWHVISMEFSNSSQETCSGGVAKSRLFFHTFSIQIIQIVFLFSALKQRKTPGSDFFVAVPCRLHNRCCIVWPVNKRLYLLFYDRLVSLNDHVTPWLSILYPNTWLYNFETTVKGYRMWCIRDLCGKTLNVSQVSKCNCKWLELFVISKWNNKGNSWPPLWWDAQSWIGANLCWRHCLHFSSLAYDWTHRSRGRIYVLNSKVERAD